MRYSKVFPKPPREDPRISIRSGEYVHDPSTEISLVVLQLVVVEVDGVVTPSLMSPEAAGNRVDSPCVATGKRHLEDRSSVGCLCDGCDVKSSNRDHESVYAGIPHDSSPFRDVGMVYEVYWVTSPTSESC